MRIISSVAETRAACHSIRTSAGRLALVPTMGALHDGHLQLVREAGRRALPIVVSIFVNPTQFGPDEDFDRYPRTIEADVNKLTQVGGVELVFVPSVSEMYPEGVDAVTTQVTVKDLPDHLCGAFRPGHFDGVTTVVSKLFNICRPTVAFFGRKDAQQFVIISKMAKDLDFGVDVVGVDTVREADGLALSSRNAYLNDRERKQAVVLNQAVTAARELVAAGEKRSEVINRRMTDVITSASLARLQYAQVVSAKTLRPKDTFEAGDEVLAAVAVFFGNTRLIDNAFVTVP